MTVRKGAGFVLLLMAVLAAPAMCFAAAIITDTNSTQPRGFGGNLDKYFKDRCSQGPVYNDQGQDLCPIIDGFYSPQHYVGMGGQGSQDRYFYEWKGMMMGNSARDPSFFAMLSVVNKDFVNLLFAAAGKGWDATNTDLYNLVGLDTARKVVCALKLYEPVTFNPSTEPSCQPGPNPVALLPADELPVAADLCLRCHFTAGWLEGRSEPESPHFPYLRGQFWGAAMQEYPVKANGDPDLVDISKDSESDMQGIQCAYCHRQEDNYKRDSVYDGTTLPKGAGTYFVNKYDPFNNYLIRPTSDFQKDAIICGTCHDVTNPLIFNRNKDLADKYNHPIERTYTEWYWRDTRSGGANCIDCHIKMQFQGAQTWMIYPGLDRVWGAVDEVWNGEPYSYDSQVTPFRTNAYQDARARSVEMMQDAANLEITSASGSGGTATVKVKVTNLADHKLPTGFSEGRQMWLQITVRNSRGKVVWQDGVIDAAGKLTRTPDVTRVYEQIALAEGYENFTRDGKSIIDADKNGTVSHKEKEFHFVLMNYIEKDNRIPPKGFIKDAYEADGAFIVPYPGTTFGRPDNDYVDGQNWDETTYTIPLARGDYTVTAELKYQTFNKELIDFLAVQDTEKTEVYGGRARSMPCNDGSVYCNTYDTWGKLLQQVWLDAGKGQPVLMETASRSFRVR